MLEILIIVAVGGYAWMAGWWSHECKGVELIVAQIWPIAAPIALLYHWWVWGPARRKRYVYLDRRWWQRGDTVRRG